MSELKISCPHCSQRIGVPRLAVSLPGMLEYLGEQAIHWMTWVRFGVSVVVAVILKEFTAKTSPWLDVWGILRKF